MLKRLLSLVLAALIAVPAPVLPAQAAPPSIERPVAHAAGDAAPALPRLAQRLGDTIPPLYMLGGDDKIAPVASFNAATDPFPSAILSHSRPSLATMFDSTGKLTYAPNNLLTYSNTFSNAAWTKFETTIGGTTPGPNGLTGTLVVPKATNATHSILESVTTASRTIAWAVVKGDGTYNAASISNNTNAYVHFDLTNGNYSSLGSGWAAAGSQSLGSGWYLIWALQSATTSYGYVAFYANSTYLSDGNTPPTFTGNATNGVYFAQTGVSAVTYETTPRTGDQVITTSAAYYGPRLDYTYNGSAWVPAGLLLEQVAGTNLVTNSPNLSGWVLYNGSRTTPGTLASDGATLSAKISKTSSGTGNSVIAQSANFALTSGTTYTASIDVDGSSGDFPAISVQYDSFNWFGAVFNTNTNADGSATQTAGGSTSGAVAASTQKYLGGGRYRLSITGTITASGSAAILAQIAKASTGVTFVVGGIVSATYAGTEYVLYSFAQVEAGSYATSYIPTGAASVTRASDALTAASLTTNPAIIQYRSISTGTRARKVINPWSGVSSEQNEWIEAFRIYPSGTSSTWLNAHLTVDGAW